MKVKAINLQLIHIKQRIRLKLFGLWRAIQPHLVPLVLVTIAVIVGQYITFVSHPLYSIFRGDSTDYINFANSILASLHIFDPARTPGYPLLLAIVFDLKNGQSFSVVVFIQAALLIHATYMVYLLSFRLSANRWVAMLVALLMGINTYLLNWEREILSETLTIWLIVMIFLMLERYVSYQRRSDLIVLTALLTYSVFTRPFDVFIPALIFAFLFLYALRKKELKREWKPLLAAALVAYGMVGVFILGNGIIYGYFGLSEISSVNLFAKVMEYKMQTEYTDPQYTVISAQLNAFEQAKNGIQPFVFLNHTHSPYSYDHYTFAADYAKDIFWHHPGEYTLKSLHDTWLAMTLPQIYYDPHHSDPAWFQPVTQVTQASMTTYLFLPFIIIAALIWWWRQPRSGKALVVLLLALTQVGSLLEIGFLSYAYPYRLRMPLDWAMLTMTGVLLALALQKIVQYCRAKSQPSANVTLATHLLDDALDETLLPTQKLNWSLLPTKKRALVNSGKPGRGSVRSLPPMLPDMAQRDDTPPRDFAE